MTSLAPFSQPLSMMAKPIGARCNLACTYCYYLDKDELKAKEAATEMSDAMLETFVRQYMEAQAVEEVQFIWHGGEPLLRGMDFYEKALRLQQRYANGRRINNVIQTNGTLLTDEWCTFLQSHHFLVGVSIDGPAELHDAFRHNRHGKGTHARVMEGIRCLQRHGVEWNAMATVNAANVEHPAAFYRFFRNIGCRFLQFTPVVEREQPNGDDDTCRLKSGSIASPRQWGHFLCTLFDEWVRRDVGQIYVQLFDATLANWMGIPPGVCSMGTSCGGAASMETDGSVYACDHFTTPAHKLGIMLPNPSASATSWPTSRTEHGSSMERAEQDAPVEGTLTQILWSPAARTFARRKTELLSRQCRRCPFLFACHGECPRNRFVADRFGTPNHNYLCEGYLDFFHHVTPAMDFMANELRHQRPPSNIMTALAQAHI